MRSSLGKAAIITVLLLAITGVVYLKGQQGREAQPPESPELQTTVTSINDHADNLGTTPVTSPDAAETPSVAPTAQAAPAVTPHPKPTTKSQKTAAKSTQTPPTIKAAVTKPAIPVRLPRLLELGADQCVPCKMMQPVLAELRQEYAGRLQVDFIDVWKDTAAGDKYGVQGIPTQILFDADGKEIFRHVGFFAKEDILATFAELGITL